MRKVPRTRGIVWASAVLITGNENLILRVALSVLSTQDDRMYSEYGAVRRD